MRAPPRRTGRREHSGAGILKRFCPYPGRADSRYTRCTRYVQREENGSLMKSGADLRSAALVKVSMRVVPRECLMDGIPSRNAVTVFRGVFYCR